MVTLFVNVILVMAMIRCNDFYATVCGLGILAVWDICFILSVAKANNNTQYHTYSNKHTIQSNPVDYNEGYHGVDWNCNSKVDWWEE